jgi:hypothetical protein
MLSASGGLSLALATERALGRLFDSRQCTDYVRDSSQVQVHLDPEVSSHASLVDKDTVWALKIRQTASR